MCRARASCLFALLFYVIYGDDLKVTWQSAWFGLVMTWHLTWHYGLLTVVGGESHLVQKNEGEIFFVIIFLTLWLFITWCELIRNFQFQRNFPDLLFVKLDIEKYNFYAACYEEGRCQDDNYWWFDWGDLKIDPWSDLTWLEWL